MHKCIMCTMVCHVVLSLRRNPSLRLSAGSFNQSRFQVHVGRSGELNPVDLSKNCMMASFGHVSLFVDVFSLFLRNNKYNSFEN